MSMIFIGYSPEDEKKERKYYEEMENTTEQWRPVYLNGVVYPYEISNLARLRRVDTHKIIKPLLSSSGYYQYELWKKNKSVRSGAHRLVATAFIPVPNKYIKDGYEISDLEINHIDGVKTHNLPYNLEWCTSQENIDHAWKIGLCDPITGQNASIYSTSKETVHRICKLLARGWSSKDISDELGVTFDTVRNIRAGKSWKYISKKYKFKPSIASIPYKIDDATFHKICQDIEDNEMKNKEIAKKYNIAPAYVSDIRRGDVRPEISKDYDFKKNAYKKLAKRDNDDLIHLICSNLQHGVKPTEIKKKYPQYKLSLSFISEIKHGKLRTDISRLYNF